MVFYWQMNEKLYHIRNSCEDYFHFLSKSSLLSLTKRGEKVKNFDPSGVVFFPFLLPVFLRLLRPQNPSLPSQELLRAHPLGFPWSRGLELRTPPGKRTGCTRWWWLCWSRPQWCWLDGPTWEEELVSTTSTTRRRQLLWHFTSHSNSSNRHQK